MSDFNIENYYLENYEKQDETILQPFVHIAEIPGKEIRTQFVRSMNHWLNIPQDALLKIEHIVETLHVGSLIIDDIQDNSEVRRGVPTSHTLYGTLRTLNSLEYVSAGIAENFLELNRFEANEIFAKRSIEMNMGQGMELYWRDNFICPTLEDYKLMCIRKTGTLFIIAIELIQLFSQEKKNFYNFAAALGLFFQIRDDYMNLCSDEYTEKKSFCEDISEGKFGFPMIHAIRTKPDDKRVINILKQKTTDIDKKKYCLELLKQFGSLDYTKQLLIKLKNELLEELDKLPENPMIVHLLYNVLNFDT